MTQTTDKERAYGIGAVAKLTGLTHQTIRAWERRYGAVTPARSENGRREYTTDDLDKFALLKQLTDQGVAISRIANDSIKELRARASDMHDLSPMGLPNTIRVAVLGEFLPGLLANPHAVPAPLDIVVADINRLRFEADLIREKSDVIVLECAILDNESIEQLSGYMRTGAVTRGVLVYTFGRSRDVDLARNSGMVVLRAPVSSDGLAAAVVRTYSADQPGPESSAAPSGSEASDWKLSEGIEPRRFSQQQLAKLANISTSIECECPRHLAQLVNDLSAFEIYSAQCSNKDDEDAALHRHLHKTTAIARTLIEEALEKVAQAEGLSY